MRTQWYYRGKKVSKKEVERMFGTVSTANMLASAKQTYMYDPLIENSFANGVLIKFKP